jgi:flagellar biosynthesis anti-sigma factor FlgM
MKIDDVRGLVSSGQPGLDAKKTKLERPGEAGAPAEADKVELSAAGQTLQGLSANAPDPAERAALIEQLKLEVAEGRLAIDAEKIADSLADNPAFADLQS